jgi:hypothetical protein
MDSWFGQEGRSLKRLMPCERRAPAFEGEAGGQPCAAESMSLKELLAFFYSDMRQLFDSNAINPEGVTHLVKEAAASNAWLIFYSHDVDEQPGNYGCTPGLFEAALETALAEQCEILPARNALGMIGFRQ